MDAVAENFPAMMHGFGMTLLLIVISSVLALVAGLVLAAMRISPIPLLRKVGELYVETFRNIPTTVIFFFTLFVLPQVGIKIDFLGSAVAALVIYYAANFCEAIRSGINAVPSGQFEAARAVGMTFIGTIREVAMPQALRAVIPPLVNAFIALTKSTAIAGAFGVAELLSVTEGLIAIQSEAVIPFLLATGTLYLAITIPAGLIAANVEKKVAVSR